MSINTLVQGAYIASDEFNRQVDSIVVRESTYLQQNTALSQPTQSDIGRVANRPNAFAFVATMVRQNTWSTSFDAWATNPNAADGDIAAQIKKLWPILVGPLTDAEGNTIEWV